MKLCRGGGSGWVLQKAKVHDQSWVGKEQAAQGSVHSPKLLELKEHLDKVSDIVFGFWVILHGERNWF